VTQLHRAGRRPPLVGGGLGIRVFDSLNVDVAAAYIVLSSFVGKATM
jgi:hypothetical protein